MAVVDDYITTIKMIISWLHSAGIAHRDVKFDNIVLDKFAQIKLIDFETAVFTDCKSEQ